MDKMLQPSISVEKFAAYLDGNLLPEEMANISSAIEQSELLQDIMDASDLADETLANYSEYELALPQELSSLDFEIPSDYLTHHSDNDNAIEFFTGNIHLKDVEFTDPITHELNDGCYIVSQHAYYYTIEEPDREIHSVFTAWPVYVD